MYLAEIHESHKRKFYDLNNLLADFGGVAKALITIFGMALLPLSKYNYNRNVTKQLYLAATK